MWQFTASLNWSVSRDTGRQGSQESGPILSPSPSSTHFHTLHPPGHLTKHKGYLLISPDLHTLRRLSNTLLDASVSHLSTLNTMPIPGRTICPVCYCCRFVHSSPPSSSSLANKASDPGLWSSEAAPTLGPQKLPPSPPSRSLFSRI